jgi:hypothetical protein
MWRRPYTQGYGEPAAKDNREYRQLRIKKAMAVTANAKRKVQKTGIAFALIHCSVLRLCILSAGLLLDHLQYRESIISIFRYSEFIGRLILNGMRDIWIFFHHGEYRLACAIRWGGFQRIACILHGIWRLGRRLFRAASQGAPDTGSGRSPPSMSSA